MRLSKYVCVCLFLSSTYFVKAQDLSSQSFLDRVFFGGGLGFNAGSDFVTFSIFPQVGYKITPRLSAGLGANYQYTNYRLVNLQLNHYGGSLFTRYMLFNNFFATTEYEYLTIEYPVDRSFRNTARQGFDSWFLGGGFVQPISRNASFTVVALYNLLHDPLGNDSPYASPFVFRAGINIGF